MTEEHEGASLNEQLISAARSDNESLLLEVYAYPDKFDINHRDGCAIGWVTLVHFEPVIPPLKIADEKNDYMTALHYASQFGSTTVLEHLLSFEGCDVDLQNRLEHDTPLHAAIKNLDDPELRNHVVESLLEAGANTKIKDKNGDIITDLVSSSSEELDNELRSAIRRAEAVASVSQSDIADDDDDESGSSSGSGSEDE